jgi:hypothetical protein
MKNATAPLGKNFFSSGDSIGMFFNVSVTKVSAGRQVRDDGNKGKDLILVRSFAE